MLLIVSELLELEGSTEEAGDVTTGDGENVAEVEVTALVFTGVDEVYVT